MLVEKSIIVLIGKSKCMTKWLIVFTVISGLLLASLDNPHKWIQQKKSQITRFGNYPHQMQDENYEKQTRENSEPPVRFGTSIDRFINS